MNIGEIIKKARIEKGYTQEELGEMVGVKKSAVAKWENGRVSEIKRSNLKKLADALGIKPTSLLNEIEEKPVETAYQLSEIFLDSELMEMIDTYQKLDANKKKQVRDFIYFLKGRN